MNPDMKQFSAPPAGWRDAIDRLRDGRDTYTQYPELFDIILDSVVEALHELDVSSFDIKVREKFLPTLPEPVDVLAEKDGFNVVNGEAVFSKKQMSDYAKESILRFSRSLRHNYLDLTPDIDTSLFKEYENSYCIGFFDGRNKSLSLLDKRESDLEEEIGKIDSENEWLR